MHILIEECIDERFRNSLTGHDCQTARYAGLAGLRMATFSKPQRRPNLTFSSLWIKVSNTSKT
jgi:hypothetical protein